MAELNLIWQTPKGQETSFEYDYITEVLFKNFDTKYYLDQGSYQTVKDNAVIIYSEDRRKASPEFIRYLNKFVKRKYKFYLLHNSNENLNHDCWYYSKANYVFRNYYDPKIKSPNLMYVPLGFQTGYMNKEHYENKCEDRTISAIFIGHPKQDRFELIDELKKLPSTYIYETKGWNCETSLTQAQCIEIYKKTKYSPCPMGNVHPDSFRLCETLEWGCIPIVRTFKGEDYFAPVFGNHPFKVVDNWSEIASIVQNPDYCAEREKVQAWYADFKKQLQNKIKEIIESGGMEPDLKGHLKLDLKTAIEGYKMSLRQLAKKIVGRK